MAITRLALSNPSATTDTLLYTMSRQAIVSVIAANKSTTTAATVRIWVQPTGADEPSEYAYISYDSEIPAKNSLESFRFATATGDEIYVRASTADVSFSLNGIYETNGTSNISVQATAPGAPTIGDVWIDTDNNIVYYWSGSAWINSTQSFLLESPNGTVYEVSVDNDGSLITTAVP